MSGLLERLRELDERLRSNWDVDWNSPRHILASDGSGKHQATAMTVPIAEDIVAMRNALPAMVTLIEAAHRLVYKTNVVTDPVGVAGEKLKMAAALAPFVGEATR